MGQLGMRSAVCSTPLSQLLPLDDPQSSPFKPNLQIVELPNMEPKNRWLICRGILLLSMTTFSHVRNAMDKM